MTIWNTPITNEILDATQHADEVPFIGQPQLKAQVEPFLARDKFPHVLLTGDPGLGKTQFAMWIAWKRGRPFYERLAPVQLDELPPYGVMLIDEVHRQRNIEVLFPIMDKGILSLVAATTKPEKLDAAFRSRFLLTLHMRPYTEAEMAELITSMAPNHDEEHRATFARASAGNPRQAKRLVMTAEGLESWDPDRVLQSAQITADGLTYDHWVYLKVLKQTGRPTGIEQIATLARMDSDDLKRTERILLDLGLVQLKASGRKLTLRGEQYLTVLQEAGVI